MIRPPSPGDAAKLIAMGRAFFEEAGYEGSTDFFLFNDDDFADSLALMNAHSLLLVADKAGEAVGMAAFDVAPAFWNRSVLLARELLWYVEPAHRQGIGRQMLQALEVAARDRGARVLDVIAEEGKRNLALARVYRASGFSPSEHSFRKVLNGFGG